MGRLRVTTEQRLTRTLTTKFQDKQDVRSWVDLYLLLVLDECMGSSDVSFVVVRHTVQTVQRRECVAIQ